MRACPACALAAALFVFAVSPAPCPTSAQDQEVARAASSTAARPLSPFYYFAKNYQGRTWSYPDDLYRHLRDDLAHHGFSDVELRGLSPAQLERLHSAHHEEVVHPGQKPPETGPAVSTPHDDAMAYRYRGSMWALDGNFAEAVADYHAALELEPGNSHVLSSLAWLHATCPAREFRNGALAVDCATKACTLTQFKAWNQLGTLAAAHAEAGDFAAAVKWARQSLELAPESEKPGCARRLNLYDTGLPFRKP